MILRFLPIITLLWVFFVPVWADASVNDDESFMHNTRWAFDASTRQIRNLDAHETSSLNTYGLDLHKVFTGADGDIGTLVFQPFVAQIKNMPMYPTYFEDGDDWDLQWRVANFNYTGFSKGGFNIRAGHFEVPFGLEQSIDTNGTLRQYSFLDRGVKCDWGVTVNGNLSQLDYEFAFSRGSGNDYLRRDDPYILSGRVGTPGHQNTIYGLSYFYGEVLAGDKTTKRKRLGFDIAHYVNQWELLAEVSGGENADGEVANWLGEVSWRNIRESVHLYVQARNSFSKQEDSWEDRFNSTFGANWNISRQFSLGAQVVHEFENSFGSNADTTASLQLRLRM